MITDSSSISICATMISMVYRANETGANKYKLSANQDLGIKVSHSVGKFSPHSIISSADQRYLRRTALVWLARGSIRSKEDVRYRTHDYHGRCPRSDCRCWRSWSQHLCRHYHVAIHYGESSSCPVIKLILTSGYWYWRRLSVICRHHFRVRCTKDPRSNDDCHVLCSRLG